jgi:hypothetical protein
MNTPDAQLSNTSSAGPAGQQAATHARGMAALPPATLPTLPSPLGHSQPAAALKRLQQLGLNLL